MASDEFSPFLGMPENVQFGQSEFMQELTSLCNRYSLENVSNVPDFILSNFIANCLKGFNEAVQQRDSWYGIKPHPGWRATHPELEGENPSDSAS